METDIEYRLAEEKDLAEIVRLLADDELGQHREKYAVPVPDSYRSAFAEIMATPLNEVIVAEMNHQIVGTFQLTFIPSLSFQGTKRMQIEAVRIDKPYRNRGLGSRFMQWAIDRARQKGCRIVQLSTNHERPDAHRFYERLGFQGTHLGMKLYLD